jgi:hypothetical protein
MAYLCLQAALDIYQQIMPSASIQSDNITHNALIRTVGKLQRKDLCWAFFAVVADKCKWFSCTAECKPLLNASPS